MIRNVVAMALELASDGLRAAAARLGPSDPSKAASEAPSTLRRAAPGSVLSEQAAAMLAPPELPPMKRPKTAEPLEGSVDAEIATLRGRDMVGFEGGPRRRNVPRRAI
jgi:hypothetical protein